MAKHLARIHGTEEDKVNCPFYFKIGACRHEDRCSRLHHKPAFSQTILLKHMYKNPNPVGVASAGPVLDSRQTYEDFLDFFEDVFLELSKFGRLEGLHVVDNLGDHMIGHVDEEEAADALENLQGRYYDGRLLQVEYSPVTDFREARCRDFDEGTCSRAGFCNFLHVKPLHMGLIRSLEADADDAREEIRRRREHKKRKHDKKEHKSSKRERRSRSASRSPPSSYHAPLPPSHHYPPPPSHYSGPSRYPGDRGAYGPR
jgi:splicing factor U2AF 35 kDa subunit